MILKTTDLTKWYGKFLALDHFNIEVEKGEIFGFVGPNGAGKTTSMRIIATLMASSSGDAWIDGISVQAYPMEARKLVGYMPDFFGVYDNLRVHEYLDFYGDANHVPKAKRKKLAGELLELVNLSDKADFYVDTLSRGMKQRLCLARCLIHEPKLLILDEPASGMDPQARAEMKYILRALRDQGKSSIISSHILPELGELCDRVAIINRGKLLTMGTVEEISRMFTGEQARMTFTFLTEEDIENAVAILRSNTLTGEIIRENNDLEVVFRGDDRQAAELIHIMAVSNVKFISVNRTVQSLEQVFLEVINSGPAADGAAPDREDAAGSGEQMAEYAEGRRHA